MDFPFSVLFSWKHTGYMIFYRKKIKKAKGKDNMNHKIKVLFLDIDNTDHIIYKLKELKNIL